MSVHTSRAPGARSSVLSGCALASRASLGVAIGVALTASGVMAQVSSLNLDFNGSGGGFQNTGFESAYNPDNTAFNLNFENNGKLGILTAPGDTYGNYENDPDNAKNMFYTSFNVGERAVLEARVNALNLNNNFHGGGIWMGTDQDHYIRLGIIHNSFEGGVTIEALRENEDRWGQGGTYPNRPGFDIEGRNLGVNDSSTPTVGGAENGRDLSNAVLRLIRDRNAVAAYVSLDNGTTFTRVGGDGYSFNALATDATSLPIDNRTTSNPMNPDKTSSTVEGGFKVGAYALGGGTSGAVIQFDSLFAITGTPTYTGPASGDWTDNANWNDNNGIGAPTNIESTALFTNTAAARTINVGSNLTATNIRFESAAGTTVSGVGEVRFDWFYFPTHPDYYTNGPGTVTVTQGAHLISAPSTVVHMHNFNVAAGGTLTLSNMTASPLANLDAGIRKQGAGTMQVNRLVTANVDVQAGTLKLAAGGGAANLSTVKTIAVSTAAGSTAKLDVTDNAVVINYDGATSPLAAINAMVVSGYATGNWSGPGIVSSSAAANPNHSIGIAEAATLAVIPALFGTVDSTAVLLRYTLKGDSNLSGNVAFDDLLRLAQNYGGTGLTWTSGDSNYDGNVNFADLLALAQNYGQGPALSDSETALLGTDFLSEWTLARSLVPEPASVFAMSLFGTALARRRRNSRA